MACRNQRWLLASFVLLIENKVLEKLETLQNSCYQMIWTNFNFCEHDLMFDELEAQEFRAISEDFE